MGKFYAVRKGRIPGIYNTWEECLKQVSKFKGAEYKKFQTEEEALCFLKQEEVMKPKLSIENLDSDTMIAYVDGSYNDDTKEFGYGVVIFTERGKCSYQGKGNKPEEVEHRNVAGEIYGAMFAMKQAQKEDKRELYIYYDYAGIENWALGRWRRNKVLTQSYKSFFDQVQNEITISFVKVKAHSQDKYNDEADRLAKEAIGINI